MITYHTCKAKLVPLQKEDGLSDRLGGALYEYARISVITEVFRKSGRSGPVRNGSGPSDWSGPVRIGPDLDGWVRMGPDGYHDVIHL